MPSSHSLACSVDGGKDRITRKAVPSDSNLDGHYAVEAGAKSRVPAQGVCMDEAAAVGMLQGQQRSLAVPLCGQRAAFIPC